MENKRELVDLVGALEQFSGWVQGVPGHLNRDHALKRLEDGTKALRELLLSDEDSDGIENQLSIAKAEWRGPMRDLLGRSQSDIDSSTNKF